MRTEIVKLNKLFSSPICRGRSCFRLAKRSDFTILLKKWSGRRGSNPQHPAWESKFPHLYFQYLQNRPAKINVHALHTVHALPDLRLAAGRLRDVFSTMGASCNPGIQLNFSSVSESLIRSIIDLCDGIRRYDFLRNQH
jgi:hypothetical protein